MLECIPFVNSLFNSVTYIITEENNRHVWIVDPGDTDIILEWLRLRDRSIKGILLTHAHFDHIYGINRLLKEYPECKIYTNSYGEAMLGDEKLNMSKYHEKPFKISNQKSVVSVNDGEKINLISGLTANVVFTPGHNPSCITWVVGNFLFTGDAYIPGIKTVTNLPGGNKKQAKESEDMILRLALNCTIFPGHDI